MLEKSQPAPLCGGASRCIAPLWVWGSVVGDCVSGVAKLLMLAMEMGEESLERLRLSVIVKTGYFNNTIREMKMQRISLYR
jgi:hypothetical protein